jgi:hypothetical protein
MKHADRVLGDKEIVAAIYEALAKRHPQSRTRGQPGFFAHHLSAIALEVKTKTIGDTHAELLAGYVGDIQKGRASLTPYLYLLEPLRIGPRIARPPISG